MPQSPVKNGDSEGTKKKQMIKQIKILKEISRYENSFNSNDIYLRKKKTNFQVYDKSQNLVFESDISMVGSILIIDNLIFFNSHENNSTYCYDLVTKEKVWYFDFIIGIDKKWITLDNKYWICPDSKDRIIKFDFVRGEVVKVIRNRDLSIDRYLIKDFYIETFEKNIVKFDLDRENLLWQIDLGTIGDYFDNTYEKIVAGRIAKCIKYNDLLIIVIGHSVLALDFETGKIKWHQSESKAFRHIQVVGNKALLSGSITFQWINLETGTFESEMIGLERFSDGEYDGILPSGFQMKYNGGNIWHSAFNRGKRFLGKYDLVTGKLLEKYDFPNGENLSSPEFQGNKIFVNTSEGDLYIFERETEV